MKEGWEYGTINDFCNVNYGTRVVRRNVTGDKYPVYGGGGETFRMDEYNREDCLVVARFAMSKQCTRIVKGKFFLNDSGLTVSPKESSGLDARLLDRFLLASNDLIYSYGRGSAQINLNVDEFRNMPLSFPKSLSEQQRIVEYLDSAFAKIDAMKDNAEKALNEAKALFQASLKEMLEPKEGWEENTLKKTCYFSQGIQVPLSNQFVKTGNGLTRFLRIIDFTQGNEPPRYVQIVEKKYWLEKDGIAIVRYGASTGYICTGLEGTLANNLFKVTIKDGIKLSSKYLFWWLNSKAFQSVIKKQMNGAAMPAISFGMINDIKIYFPSLLEQQSIVETLDSLKSKVDHLQANYDKISQECDALKQAILRQVFE